MIMTGRMYIGVLLRIHVNEPRMVWGIPAYHSIHSPANCTEVIHGFDTSIARSRRAKDLNSRQPSKSFLEGGPDLPMRSGSFALRKTRLNTSMIRHSAIPDIMGTRSGYVIQFTCPLCNTENSIVNKTPRDHYKECRDASCSNCRKHSTVITPRVNRGSENSPMSSYVKVQMKK